jgi:hypothetical protein
MTALHTETTSVVKTYILLAFQFAFSKQVGTLDLIKETLNPNANTYQFKQAKW